MRTFCSAAPTRPAVMGIAVADILCLLFVAALPGLELERDAIQAVAQAGGRRAVLEDMAEMPAAARAMHLRARIDEMEVGRGLDRAFLRGKKARPAGAAVELGVGA